MADHKPSGEPVPGDPLHARHAHGAEAKRKRKAEAKVAHSVAGAMAGEVIAAVTGKTKDSSKPD